MFQVISNTLSLNKNFLIYNLYMLHAKAIVLEDVFVSLLICFALSFNIVFEQTLV